ncbi:hypothetical protein DMENIID0001_014460 [Sergentomyia squamirostris]
MLNQKVVILEFLLIISSVLDVQCCSTVNKQVTCSSIEEFLSDTLQNDITEVTVKGQNSSASFFCEQAIFENYKSLRRVTLNSVGIFHVTEECFSGANALEDVDISSNNIISTIDMSTFKNSPDVKVTSIYLDHNHIPNLNFNTALPSLRTLSVSFNRISSFRMVSTNLSNLRHVNAANNRVSELKIESRTMEYLYMANNRLQTLNESDLILPNLLYIDLSGNHLIKIEPNMLEKMGNLRVILFSSNYLNSVAFPTLHWVAYIDLSNNRFDALSGVNITFTDDSETILVLNSNKVFRVTQQSFFKILHHFSCVYCYIHTVDPLIFAGAFSKIKVLTLDRNYLTSADFFDAYDKDLGLTHVSMAHNKLRKITTACFRWLGNLRTLALNDNYIVTLEPGAFQSLTKLQYLSLQNNLIFQFSLNMFMQTTSLKELDISGNNIAFLEAPGIDVDTRIQKAKQQTTMENLERLTAFSNPLQCSCIDQLQHWTSKNNISFEVYDSNVRNGLKPACMVNSEGCQAVEMDFIQDYWFMFNEVKLKEILQVQDND